MNDYNLETPYIPDEVRISRGRYNFSAVSFCLFAFGIIAIAIQTLFIYILAAIANHYPQIIDASWLNYILILIPMYCIAFPLCILSFKLVPKAPPRDEKLSFGSLISYFVMMVPVTLILNYLSIVLAAVLSDGSATNPLNDIVSDVNIWQILTVVILGPIVEETIFRKLIIDRTRQFGEALSIIFSALCFGLFHTNVYQLFYASALGLLLGYIYTRTGRIRYSIILHIAFNFWGSVIPLKMAEYINEDLLNKISENAANLQDVLTNSELISISIYFIYIFIELGMFIAGIILWIIFISTKKFRLHPAPMELPKGSRFKTAFINLGFMFFFAYCIYGTIKAFLN